MIDAVVGANVAALQRQSGIITEALASQCNLTTNTLQGVEDGRQRIWPPEIVNVSEALNILLPQLNEGVDGNFTKFVDIFDPPSAKKELRVMAGLQSQARTAHPAVWAGRCS